MNKWTTLFLTLLIGALAQTGAADDVIRCRTAAGTRVFADDPGRVPTDCRLLPPHVHVGGGVSVVPALQLPPAASRTLTAPGASRLGAPRRSWLGEARELSAAYRQAAAARVASLPPVQVQKARRRILALQERKAFLLQQLLRHPPPQAERREIEKLLAIIPP